MDKIKEETYSLKEEVIDLRRDFHSHPELGFEEKRTSLIIQRYLKDIGLEVINIAQTGVVGILRGIKEEKTVLLRADMDALPIEEMNEVSYKSINKGMMHACGHDGHTAMLLVAAKIIAMHREELNGNVKFVFQPSEEKDPGGAIKMIEEGVLENPHVDRAFGLHLGNYFPGGTIVIRKGVFMAEPDRFEINIKGRGGHGAYPHKSTDPILIASHIVVALQSIVSREIDPIDSVVVTVGKISSGDVFNVIPEAAFLEGTVRTLKKEIAQSMPARIERISTNIAKAFGGEATLHYYPGYPPLLNDSESTDFVKQIAEEVVGKENVIEAPISMGGEDMAYFFEHVRGAFFWLGSMNSAKGFDKPHHSAYFDFDEDVLTLGVEMHVRIAMNLLK
jgi:amidohydrolase